MFHDLKKLDAIFTRMAVHESAYSTFHQILDLFLVSFRYHDNAEAIQAAQLTLQAYPQKQLLTEFLQELAELNGEGFKDPLGEFYMLHFANTKTGQYFTPEPICEFQTQIAIGDAPADEQRILDPTCGSGRMLLAAGKINRRLLLYGADLDPVCCKMAVVNMLLNSLTGEIAHMNSLTNQFYRCYQVATFLMNGYHHPYFVEYTDPYQSYIWLRPPSDPPATEGAGDPQADLPSTPPPILINPVQGSLF